MLTVGTYSNIGDEQLDNVVRDSQSSHPGIGLRMLMGHLRGKGYRVQWERVRQSLLRTDPAGVHQRWRDSICRRKYSVAGLLALWHIDGNHKLIRYTLLVFQNGRLCLYSRMQTQERVWENLKVYVNSTKEDNKKCYLPIHPHLQIVE